MTAALTTKILVYRKRAARKAVVASIRLVVIVIQAVRQITIAVQIIIRCAHRLALVSAVERTPHYVTAMLIVGRMVTVAATTRKRAPVPVDAD